LNFAKSSLPSGFTNEATEIYRFPDLLKFYFDPFSKTKSFLIHRMRDMKFM